MPRFEADIQCKPCSGTGLYAGLGERDGAAVVCHTCKGTGKFHHVFEYEDFTGRRRHAGTLWVVQTNPGICVGTGNGHRFEDFGGMSYEDWLAGKLFTAGSEMRGFTCPAWWYQSADYDLQPKWKECGWGLFSACQHFANKYACWERFDREQTQKARTR